jgi:hypothetical protein
VDVLPAEWARELLSRLIADSTEDFAGVGLLFYREPLNLPTIPLVTASERPPVLPQGVRGAVELLRLSSRRGSPFHDGFHLVHVPRMEITHLSQFVSPPIPMLRGGDADLLGGGARLMTAYLSSLVENIDLAAVTLSRRTGALIRRGVIERI